MVISAINNSPLRALLAHPGTQHSARLAAQLHRNGVLGMFYTGVAFSDQGFGARLAELLPASWESKLANRRLSGVPPEYLQTKPWLELLALARLRMGANALKVHYQRNAAFQRAISDSAIKQAGAIIGFDTSSWIIARRAHEHGRPFILDQSIAHPAALERVYQTLRETFPDWKKDLEAHDPATLTAEQEEHRLADRISVPGTFVKSTLVENGVPAEKIVINPFGVNLDLFYPMKKSAVARPPRFLFVGSVTARKGVPLLLQAWNALKGAKAELWLAGPISRLVSPLIGTSNQVRLLGKISRKELPALMNQCDVFVFPSYFEGLPLVLLEAMACGLPVITTDAASGPDIITDGVEGFLIKAGDGVALQQAMEKFLLNLEKFRFMSEAARQRAEKFSWNAYGSRWVRLLQETATGSTKVVSTPQV